MNAKRVLAELRGLASSSTNLWSARAVAWASKFLSRAYANGSHGDAGTRVVLLRDQLTRASGQFGHRGILTHFGADPELGLLQTLESRATDLEQALRRRRRATP